MERISDSCERQLSGQLAHASISSEGIKAKLTQQHWLEVDKSLVL